MIYNIITKIRQAITSGATGILHSRPLHLTILLPENPA
jgi:hypothetical protein